MRLHIIPPVLRTYGTRSARIIYNSITPSSAVFEDAFCSPLLAYIALCPTLIRLCPPFSNPHTLYLEVPLKSKHSPTISRERYTLSERVLLRLFRLFVLKERLVPLDPHGAFVVSTRYAPIFDSGAVTAVKSRKLAVARGDDSRY